MMSALRTMRDGVARVRSESGAAAVEMALVLPLLLLLVGGVVDFGRAYFTQITLTSASREGVRAAQTGASATTVAARTQAAAVGVQVTTSATSCTSTSISTARVRASTNFEWVILDPMLSMVGASGTLPTTISQEAVAQCVA